MSVSTLRCDAIRGVESAMEDWQSVGGVCEARCGGAPNGERTANPVWASGLGETSLPRYRPGMGNIH